MRDHFNRYFIVHKPYDMVSQFVSPHNVALLKDLRFNFPAGTHAIGRLDNHSEGLLILTTNKKVTRLLFQSSTPHKRRYLVQVKDIVSKESIERLREGVAIRVRGGEYQVCTPLEAEILPCIEGLFKDSSTQKIYGLYTWLSMTLSEGKFHQVRKMVFAIGHKCLRLVRISIEDLCLGDLEAGGVREVTESEFFQRLKITPEPRP